jgi:hypothetical protein
MKQENNERVEDYSEILLKLANSIQHKTIDSFSTIIFRSNNTTISLCSHSRYKERNFVTT